MNRKTKNIHRFRIPKSAGGHYDIREEAIRGSRFKRYVPSQQLSRTLGRIYDMNRDRILEADENLGKTQFKNKVIALMKEGKQVVNEETGEIKYVERTLNEALRTMSRSTVFTSKEELGLENIRKSISKGKNKEIRDLMKLNWGVPYTYRRMNKDGTITEMTIYRIPWKQLVWDEKTHSYRMQMDNGQLSESGIRFTNSRRRGKYAIDPIAEWVDVV